MRGPVAQADPSTAGGLWATADGPDSGRETAGLTLLETLRPPRSMAKSIQALPLKTGAAEAGRGWIEEPQENKIR
jgi:hypothetical protein